MVDPIGLVFRKRTLHHPVQVLRGFKVCAERFLQNHPRPTAFARLVQTRLLQILHDRFELLGRSREVEKAVATRAAFRVKFIELREHRALIIGKEEHFEADESRLKCLARMGSLSGRRLVEQGAEVLIVNRTHEHAVALARQAKAKSLKHELLAKQKFDVMINATPCGMAGSKQALPIAENELNASLVFDMVYNPLETPLLKLAKSRGLHTIGGLEMFVQQGARQFEIWTGKPAPESEMMRVVEHELRKRASTEVKETNNSHDRVKKG